MRDLGRVALWLALVAGVAAAFVEAALASSSATGVMLARLARSGGACGVERWAVKTLQDRPHLLPNRLTTVRYLDTRRAPAFLPSVRLPFERHVFTVVAGVTFVREEADSDYHFILQEGGWHMIAEAPAPYCDHGATLHYRRLMARARRAARTCAKARVMGVAFFDYDHGQDGVAPNAIELHPILGFRCLRG